MAVYMNHYTIGEALNEYEMLTEQVRNGQLETYDYWKTLSLREGFENGRWNLSDDERARLDELDATLRKHIINTLTKHRRLEEYHDLGTPRPAAYWWWHMGEPV